MRFALKENFNKICYTVTKYIAQCIMYKSAIFENQFFISRKS